MLEYYGWLVLGYEPDEERETYWSAVRSILERWQMLDHRNRRVSAEIANGVASVSIRGGANHPQPDLSEIEAEVSRTCAALGDVFGVIHVRAGDGDRFRCLMVRRSLVSWADDPWFSPCSEKVEPLDVCPGHPLDR